MPVVSSRDNHSRPTRGAIQKRNNRRRDGLITGPIDRDGDVDMLASSKKVQQAVAAKLAPPRTQHAPAPRTAQRVSSSPTVQVRVTGWSHPLDKTRLIKFLERHGERRREVKVDSRGRPLAPFTIRRSAIKGDAFVMHLPEHDANALLKINGFTFSKIGEDGRKIEETLTIQADINTHPPAGPSNSRKSPPAQTNNGPAPSTQSELDAAKPKSQTAQLIENILGGRHDTANKLLQLQGLKTSSDTELLASDKDPDKIFNAMFIQAAEALPDASTRKEHVVSITLSNNGLETTRLISELPKTFPELENLDLSNNSFKSADDFFPWAKYKKLRNLKQLVLTGNPLENTVGWRAKIKSFFPSLVTINGIDANLSDEQIKQAEQAEQQTQQQAEQQKMVEEVMAATNMNAEFSTNLLVQSQWNLALAAQNWENTDKALIPPEAWVKPAM